VVIEMMQTAKLIEFLQQADLKSGTTDPMITATDAE
jgi:hypothetical protein